MISIFLSTISLKNVMLYWFSNMLFPSTEYLCLSLFFLRHISLHFQRLNELLLVTCRHFRIKNSLVTLWFFFLILTDVCNASHFCTVLECNMFVFSFSFISSIKIIIYFKINIGCSKMTEIREHLPSSAMPLGIMPFIFQCLCL